MHTRYFYRAALLISMAAGAAMSSAQIAFLTKPDIHGDEVLFTAEGDLWLGSIGDHSAKRITSDPGTEYNAKFSPDGSEIAFSAQYQGGTDVYVMPTEGGAPKRLTFASYPAEVQGWTPDGSAILYRSRRFVPNSYPAEVRHLFLVPAKGGQSKALPIPTADFGSIAANGLVAYVPVSFEWANWFHYKGGSADKIWLADTVHHTFEKLADFPGIDTTPVWCNGEIYFVSERSGWLNLWRMDPKTKAVKECTFYSDAPVRYPSSDGHRVIFQHGAHLEVFDPAADKVQLLDFSMDTDRIHEIEQRVPLRNEVGPATLYTNGGSIGVLGNGIALGPTGKRILLEARGQIISVASEAGDMRVLEKHPGARARFPIWSPDGKQLAFVSDRSGENEIWIGDAAGGGEASQLTHGLQANPFPPIWSPDGKWIALFDRTARLCLIDAKSGDIKIIDQTDNLNAYDATPGTAAFSPDGKYITFYHNEPNWYTAIYLYEIATGKKQIVSDPRVNCYAPAFDSTGKFLIYLADSNFDPQSAPIIGKYYYDNPTKVVMVALTPDAKSPFLPKNDEEGIAADQEQKSQAKQAATPAPTSVDWNDFEARTFSVPLPPGKYSRVDALPGKILVLNQSSPGPSASELISFDLNTQKPTTLISGIDEFEKSFDGKKLLFVAGQSMSVHDADAGPTSMSAGAVDLTPYSITYDPVPEWHQVFEESWRVTRDFFYDPNMTGVDWNAMRKKYEARLSLVGDRLDLTRLIADMMSELNIGHAYVINPPTAPAHPLNMGFLGIDVEPVPGADAVKITKLYQGDPWTPELRSPLLDPGIGVKAGDYILEIAGSPVKADEDIEALLLGTRGETVAVMVNDKPTRDGARVVRVRPLLDERELRYQDWVMGRTRYVEEHGGPNFGYAHIPDMENGGLIGFAKGHYPDTLKQGMIYDTRYNGGGYTSSLILQDIAARPLAWFKPRVGNPWAREGWATIAHRAALCNEFNFSDGEFFVEEWKKMKLGPVVGVRTGGGETGSGGGYGLIDHGSIYVPNYGAYMDDRWIVEGKGATPTDVVEQDPNAVMAGRDPQLDKAIELLKQEIAKDPPTVPQHPPFPIRTVPPGPGH